MNRALPLFLSLLLFGCTRSSDEFWDDARSAGRHMERGLSALCGKEASSRQVYHPEDFYSFDSLDVPSEELIPDLGKKEQVEEEYIAIADLEEGGFVPSGDFSAPYLESGDDSGFVPRISSFRDPKEIIYLSTIYQNICFPYNSALLKGKADLKQLREIAAHLHKNPEVYLFVEGHCDERGPEAYNLSLGARRAQSVRQFLIREGVDPERIYTVSYGKERPIAMGNNEEAWRQNRRAEFKIYER